MGFCPSTNWCRISSIHSMSTLGSWSHHGLSDHVAQIHVPTRHFREALLSPPNHGNIIYGNQNNSKSSKMSVIKMSNQNAPARLNDLGPTDEALRNFEDPWPSMTAGPRHPGNQKPAELSIFFEVTIFSYVFYINISICEYYIRIYLYYMYKKYIWWFTPWLCIYIYTKHNMIIYPWNFSYSHSYAFRWIQRCSDLPSVPAVRSTRASDWLPPARVAPRQIWLRGRWVKFWGVQPMVIICYNIL
jgi:hypothetical protein